MNDFGKTENGFLNFIIFLAMGELSQALNVDLLRVPW